MKRYYVHEIQDGVKGSILKNAGDATWVSGDDVAMQYSQMKYGDPKAIRLAANEIFNRIILDENLRRTFLSFPIAITNSARAVPTASFTIMRVLVEDFLNPWLDENDSSQVIWVRSNSSGIIPEEDYGKLNSKDRSTVMQERGAFFDKEEVIKLHGRKVILFDDLIATGAYERDQTELLVNSGVNPNDIIPLYWLKIADVTVQRDPSFEAVVNNFFVKKLSDLLTFFLNDELIVNARTMKFILSSEKGELLRFFMALYVGNESRFQECKDIGRRILLKIYYAAKSSDGYWKMNRFQEGFAVLNNFLLEVDCHPETVMRHKLSVFEIDRFDDLDPEVREMYSCFKYGDPVSVRRAAELMVCRIKKHNVFRDAVKRGEVAIITSSAFGEVPTAAHSIAQDVQTLLASEGCVLRMINISRSGDFGTTNYGQMSETERKKRMEQRQITVSDDAVKAIEGKIVLVIDDLNATGSHEITLWNLLKKTSAKHTLFCYLIDFSDRLARSEPHTEELLNNAKVRTVLDLVPFFTYKGDLELRVNARMIKFILSTGVNFSTHERAQKIRELNQFLAQMSSEALKKIFKAAYSQDGYYQHPKFVGGFNILMSHMVAQRIISIDEANRIKNCTISYYVSIDSKGDIIDGCTGEKMNEIGIRYSLMKFGGPNEIEFFGREMAKKFIERMSNQDDNLRSLFQRIKKRGESVICLSPGSRNVESSQNFIFEVAIRHINVWLALNELPTIILTKLSRLGSNVANYATLPVEERINRSSKTKTILPGNEFFKSPAHIVFCDDTRITGSTADRVELHCLNQGAKSFFSMYCMLVDPQITSVRPDVENFINNFLIKGGLDKHVAYILNHKDFTPVQRMVRLILSEDNRKNLEQFLRCIRKESVVKLYFAALGNDYLQDERYAPSIPILMKALKSCELVNSSGLVV